jgi:hypothetical protein
MGHFLMFQTIIRNSLESHHDISYAELKKKSRGHSEKFQWYGRRDVSLGKPVMNRVKIGGQLPPISQDPKFTCEF